MTTVRHLYDLQELDQEIDRSDSLKSSIDGQLGDRSELEALLGEVETQKDSLSQLRAQSKTQELDAESVRAKVLGLEGKLYGGTVQNLRELEGFEKEATYLRVQLKELDDRVLEAMVSLEEAQERLRSLEDGLRQGEERWRIRQSELAEERKQLEETLTRLTSRRRDLVGRVGQQELRLYESLRLSKGGLAISKVERGQCRGCRIALPTHQLQRARSGREPVQCNSCGRILFVS